MRMSAALSSAALIGAALLSASQAQVPAVQVGAGHVGTSVPRVGATTPSTIQSTVARHTGIPNVRAWQQGAVDTQTAAYCARRFRSYDANSGTYLSRDGRRHICP
jgi:BA14K-like protein